MRRILDFLGKIRSGGRLLKTPVEMKNEVVHFLKTCTRVGMLSNRSLMVFLSP